jgi:hypothetical protein
MGGLILEVEQLKCTATSAPPQVVSDMWLNGGMWLEQ